MRFDPPMSPQGNPPIGVLESMLCMAWLMREDGLDDENSTAYIHTEFDYAGESKMYWDSQEMIEDEWGTVTLIDKDGNEWQAKLL